MTVERLVFAILETAEMPPSRVMIKEAGSQCIPAFYPNFGRLASIKNPIYGLAIVRISRQG